MESKTEKVGCFMLVLYLLLFLCGSVVGDKVVGAVVMRTAVCMCVVV